ncbi:CAP domain-containing protein, partial [Salmonella sp. s55004]|uniref:CAP domain-containing protein n=1 Tax=Salmonella sp. s55004 TaxID=3159675 RepID=UPI00397F7BAF
HFTQVVWAKTTKVGCGIKFCLEATSDYSSYPNAWLVTCNYSPAGNWQGEKPYKSGTECTECEKGFCMNNLCSKCKSSDQGCECNIECKNCGTKVAKTCSCNCPDGYYGSNCANRCQDTHEYCGANPGWPSSWCNNSDYAFVDEKCPKMCGICRAGPRNPRC